MKPIVIIKWSFPLYNCIPIPIGNKYQLTINEVQSGGLQFISNQ